MVVGEELKDFLSEGPREKSDPPSPDTAHGLFRRSLSCEERSKNGLRRRTQDYLLVVRTR